MVKPIISGLGGYSQGGPVTVYSPGISASPQTVRFSAGITAYPGEITPTTPDVALATAPQWQVDWTRDTGVPGQLSLSRTTSAVSYNARGIRTTAASGGPRLDYAGDTGAPLGLLLEEQRSNIILHSSDLNNNTSLTAQDLGTFAVSTVLESDNSHFLMKFVAGNAFTQQGFHIGTTTVTSGVPYSFSIEVQRLNWDFLGFSFSNGGPDHASIVFSFVTKTITETHTGGTGSVIASYITPLANGSYRIGLVASMTSTAVYVLMGLAASATGNTWATNGYPSNLTGAGNGFYASGVQLELGSFPTSYIVTTTAAVTRNADLLSTTNSDLLANQAWEVEAGQLNITSGSTATLLGVNTVTGLGVNTSNALTTADGGTQTTANTGTWTGTNRAGLAWTP
jgi:hypothetical protein